MTESPPDIEIYLKRAASGDIIDWLKQHFQITEIVRQGDSHKLTLDYEGRSVECVIVEKAAKGGYVSVWFKNNETPWRNDEECAREAFKVLGVETRCSTGGWEPSSDDSGSWYRFTDAGQSVVNWQA